MLDKLDGNTIIIEVNGDKDEINRVELSEVQEYHYGAVKHYQRTDFSVLCFFDF